ncbi:MAG: hypothetical protein ACOH2M_20350, partial [Cypionkella sp.]
PVVRRHNVIPRVTGVSTPYRADRRPNHTPINRQALHTIELAFSKFKALLRKAAERTVPPLWGSIGETLKAFTPQECSNYFRHDGYAPT